VPSHFQSAHFASVHFLGWHFSGGTEQVIVAEIPHYDVGNEDDMEETLRRLPNGHIIAIATAALMICYDELE